MSTPAAWTTTFADLPTFGVCLRTLRMRRGLSLCQTARLVPCNKGYLCKIEHDKGLPSLSMARALDQLLHADGALIAALGRHLLARVAGKRPAPTFTRPTDIRPAGYRNAAVYARVFGPPAALAVAA